MKVNNFYSKVIMPSFYQDELKEQIGTDLYTRLEKEAEKEVVLALQMPLVDEYRKEKYYRQRFLLGDLLKECHHFENVGLKISPLDCINILFRCKLLYAAQVEDEYRQRIGGGLYIGESGFIVKWSEKADDCNIVIDRYFRRLISMQKERTLLTEINSFDSTLNNANPQVFFGELFKKLNLPFIPFFESEHLIEKHKEIEPYLKSYTLEQAKVMFCAPSIGFTVFGSETYCYWHASIWLRTLLNLLRIVGFIYPYQMDFGRDVQMVAPISPVFLGTNSTGGYCWDEDKKEPWAKIPDGCLFLSFGYRGLAKMWLDERTFGGIEKFILENKIIFDYLKNPWNANNLYDIAPVLDILSSATQISDVGGKVLLIYCCLEHMFVPNDVNSDNKKYIIGGINALKPDLLHWFDSLYKLRCAYAHKGFILRDDKTIGVIMDCMRSVIALLVAKLSIS